LDRLVDKKLLDDPTIDDVLVTDPSQGGKKKSIDENFFVKAERSGISIKEFTDRYFTKTSFYNQLGRLHKFAFTGRKGSGKTTLLQVYKYQNRRKYFSPIDIQVNDWNLHYVLGDLTFKPNFRTTFENITFYQRAI
jgi:ABC-type transport system involved in cytochrome c biogenesis ATPase subunit